MLFPKVKFDKISKIHVLGKNASVRPKTMQVIDQKYAMRQF